MKKRSVENPERIVKCIRYLDVIICQVSIPTGVRSSQKEHTYVCPALSDRRGIALQSSQSAKQMGFASLTLGGYVRCACP